MQYIQLYVQKQGQTGYSSYTELDLFAEEPIKLTRSVQDEKDPNANTSDFSRTFRVPATPKNADFFKSVFNVNSYDFDATKSADAYINVNGSFFVSGNIRLVTIFRIDSQQKIEYEIMFLGEAGNFSSVVAPKDLSSLNLADFSHVVSYLNITNSWNNSLFNGDIVYPLAEWGYTYDPSTQLPQQSTLSVYGGTASTKGFTNSANPLALTQWKPAIRVKAIWDRIFRDSGFTYQSSFIGDPFTGNGSALFKNLYMMSSNTDTAELQTNLDFGALASYTATIPLNTVFKLPFEFESYDDSNSYNPSTSEYTVPFTGGPYDFTIYDLQLDYTTISPIGVKNLTLALYVNGVPAVSKTCTLAATPSGGATNQVLYLGSDTISFNAGTLTKGDIVDMRITMSSGVFVAVAGVTIFTGEWYLNSPNIFDPSGLLPLQYKQIDFIRGINERFKMVWEPDPNNPKNFFIEPWNIWIQNGIERDWSDKLDENNDVVVTPLFYNYDREVIYRDSPEDDLYNFSYRQANKETFGELKQDSGIALIKGERVITSFFAGFPVAPIGLSDDFLIPHFAKDTETERQPIQVKPRLCYYNGVVPAPKTWYMETGTGTATMTTYPLISNYSQYPFNSQAIDISWTNSKQFWDPIAVGFDGRTNRTSFSEYWANWFSNTYNAYSRQMEATFVLDYDDVKELSFNDKIFIKDSWWIVIRIEDFVLGAKAACKVILQKLGAVGINIGGPQSSGVKLWDQGFYCYSDSDCGACCCVGFVGYTLWTNNEALDISTRFYIEATGKNPAPAGYYSNGSNFYQITTGGVLVSVGTCEFCDCAEGLVEYSNICFGQTLCDACCCINEPITVYANGESFDTSTVAYSNNTGTATLTPFWWYHDPMTNTAIQVGEDGFTVIQAGICDGCDCEE
jgi:hypothetical protein